MDELTLLNWTNAFLGLVVAGFAIAVIYSIIMNKRHEKNDQSKSE